MSNRHAESEQLNNERTKRPNRPDISASPHGSNESASSADTTSVTDDEIYEATKDLGPDELQHLFHNLGIAQHDIDNAEKSADTKDPRLRAVRVLHFWKQSRGNDATRHVLHQAKEKALWQRKHQDEDIADNWRDKLKEKYKQRPTIRFGRNRRAEAETDDIFVDLKLLEDKERGAGRPLKSYYELFHNLDHGVGRAPVNGTLLQGPAGIGKSTLLSRFAYLWANESDSKEDSVHTSDEMQWDEFKLVFLIKLKYLKDGESLEKTIVSQLLADVSETQITSILTKLGSKCLILLDGYDEIPKDVSAYALKSPLLCKCRVIVTTRPHLVDQFHQDDDKPRYADVLISGFSSKNSTKYIQKFFRCNKQPNIGEDLIDKIEEMTFFERFASHPILLVMLCLLWLNPDKREYQVYSWTVLFENAVKYLNKPFQTQSEISSDILDNVLLELGKPALEAMFDDAVQIRSAKFDKETLKKSFLIGLLIEEEGFHTSDALVTFIHKTFQEFCAAKYLANLAESDSELFKNMLHEINMANLFDMEYVLRFCCGLSIDAAKVILPHTIELVIPVDTSFYNRRVDLTIPFLMLYESEIYNSDYPNEAIKSLHNALVPLIEYGTETDDDLFRNYIKGSLVLSNMNGIALFYLALSCNNNSHVWLKHIERLLVGCRVSINTLMRLLGCMSSVKSVTLHKVKIDGEVDENISVSCTSLTEFEMGYSTVSANTMMRLLGPMPAVKSIALDQVTIEGEIDENTSVSCTSLTEFKMYDLTVSANTLMRLLGCMPAVKSVTLDHVIIMFTMSGEVEDDISVSCESLTLFHMRDSSITVDIMIRLLECISPRAIVKLDDVQITDSDGVDVLGCQNERNNIVWFWRANTLVSILQRHTQQGRE